MSSNEPSPNAIASASTTPGLPVAPSMGPALRQLAIHPEAGIVSRKLLRIAAWSIVLAVAAAFIAQLLTRLIGFITNLAFYGRVSFELASPAGNHLGWLVVFVPVIGGLLVGVMARYGSAAIRGHGIPEAMEQVLFNRSRIPARITLLKPISAAISIGTGGPFGAEGPIIATGGALGSLIGQLTHTTADERKTLLAAGAAAGMAATFGSPVAAVLLAIELLLFEYRARSVIPVSLAAATAAGVRIAISGSDPVFAMAHVTQPGGAALVTYIVLGAVVGLVSIGVTRVVYWVEDAFEHVFPKLHWMWWPAIGAVAVGVIGVFAPRTMGVGYDNIEGIVQGSITGRALFVLCGLKLVSWAISLGSGTSGGTLAPLFTIGGGLGALLGVGVVLVAPSFGVDPRIAGLVGMAAMFAGASRALLASVVFAFETTRQPVGLLPLLGGCTAAYFVSSLFMRNTIMTEKIARRGVRVPAEYAADHLDQVMVREFVREVVTLSADRVITETRAWLASRDAGARHQGYPVVDPDGALLGVVTRRDFLHERASDGGSVGALVQRPAVVAYPDESLRDVADRMVAEGVGRVPIVTREAPKRVVGIVTRSDILAGHARRLEAEHLPERTLRVKTRGFGRSARTSGSI